MSVNQATQKGAENYIATTTRATKKYFTRDALAL
jgi:hypothetical protein